MDAPYAHIACCIDDSDASRGALAEARRLRALGPGRLTLVHVVPWPLPYSTSTADRVPDLEPILQEEGAWLDQQAAAAPEAEPLLLKGAPAPRVCDWARDAGVDLLVVASHRGRASRLLLGSFAHHCAHHAPCALLVVGPPAIEPHR